MKSGSKVMTKGALIKTLAEQHEMKTKVCSGLLESLATLATTEVKKTGIFTSVVARVAKLSRSPEHTFVFISCCSASVLMRAPFVMTLLPDFMDFIAFMVFMRAMAVENKVVWSDWQLQELEHDMSMQWIDVALCNSW